MTSVIPSSTSILALHPPSISALPFLHRLIEKPLDSKDTPFEMVPWHINNKYYTADIHFRILELLDAKPIPGEYNDIDVVLYLFDRLPKSVPSSLIHLLSEPKDVTIAIRVRSDIEDEDEEADEKQGTWEEVEDMFVELGMEVVDELAAEDEYTLNPLEDIRQTLQTHLWPNMVRKPLAQSTAISPGAGSSDGEEGDEGEESFARFPTTFESGVRGDEVGVGDGLGAEFPGLEDLRVQVQLGEMERMVEMGRVGRLEMFDRDEDDGEAGEGFGIGEEEYERLEEWLEEDGEDDTDGFEHIPEEEDERDYDQSNLPSANASTSQSAIPPSINTKAISPPPTAFEDDFDDFAAFQSGPPVTQRERLPTLAMDPTPLLLHLQTVRAELSGVEDEDERRERAGKEVLRVMRDLGMDMGLGGMEGFDDLGEEEVDFDSLRGL